MHNLINSVIESSALRFTTLAVNEKYEIALKWKELHIYVITLTEDNLISAVCQNLMHYYISPSDSKIIEGTIKFIIKTERFR